MDLPHAEPTTFTREPQLQKCNWHKCPTKRVFRTRSELNTHIKNIHTDPLMCMHPGCPYKKPFGKVHDLKRHMETKHNTEHGYPCPENGCLEVFPRKDKMMQHAKEKHTLHQCPYNHCFAVIFSVEIEPHLCEQHGNYECSILSCTSNRKSHFTRKSIIRHLRTQHQISYWVPPGMLKNARFENGVFYVEPPSHAAYQDCASCAAGPENLNEE